MSLWCSIEREREREGRSGEERRNVQPARSLKPREGNRKRERKERSGKGKVEEDRDRTIERKRERKI